MRGDGSLLFAATWVDASADRSTTLVEPAERDSRVVYERAGALEWYEETTRGIEHGVTLDEHTGSGDTAEVIWCLEGIASAELFDKASVLRLVPERGDPLRVDRLEAWDKTGRPLPAHFSLEGHGQCGEDVTYRLVVDVRDARFPIEIDPTFHFEQTSIVVDGLKPNTPGGFALEDDMLIVGQPEESSLAPKYGVLSIYERHAGGINAWGKTGEVRPPMGFNDDNPTFGANLVREGDWLALSVDTTSFWRAVWIYKKVNGQWVFHRAHEPDPAERIARYGHEAMIMQDGILAVTSRRAGIYAVYVYEVDRGGPENWGLAKKISSPDRHYGPPSFGNVVALSGDRIAIAADGYAHSTGSEGRVYIYRQDPFEVWKFEQIIDGFEPMSTASDRFAKSMHLSGDTFYVARRRQLSSVGYSGSVEVYKRTGPADAPWVHVGEIWPKTPIENGDFGAAIISTDETLYVSARKVPRTPQDTSESAHPGGIHVLREDASASGGWSDRGEVLVYDHPRTTEEHPTEIDASGRMVGSASGVESNLTANSGRIYLFNLNHPPVAVDERLETNEDTKLFFSPDVTDQENDPVRFVVTSAPQNGAIEPSGDQLVYTPRENFFGVDGFSYVAWDAHEPSQPAVVTIDVLSVEDPPIAQDLTLSTSEDTPAMTTLQGAVIEGSQALRFELVTQPEHGSVSLVEDQVTYMPAPDFYGEDAFTYRAMANLPSLPATVTVEVVGEPDAPRFPGLPATREVMWGEDFSFRVEVEEVDGESTVTSVADALPDGATFLGGTFTWRPTFEQVGEHEITIQAFDGVDTSMAVLTVVVLVGDEDGNGIPDDEDVRRGFDPFSPDDDGDGILDEDEVGDWEMPVDTDGDGIPDILDTDSDDDGITDDVDSCPRDVNSSSDVDDDGIDDVCDDDIRFVEDFAWVESEEPEDRLQSRGCVVGGTHHKESKPSHLFVLALFFVAIHLRRKPTRRIG